jgi:DNA polymerase-3 subunit epsilon
MADLIRLVTGPSKSAFARRAVESNTLQKNAVASRARRTLIPNQFARITDEMVAGHRIDPDAVGAFVSDTNIIIAHNANFDRRFAERFWQTFVDKRWACSVNEIEWRNFGFEGSRRGYLLAGVGLFHEAHRAVDDCRALLEILAHKLLPTQRTALDHLLETARRRKIRIWAEPSPYELKDELKKRGYRWSAGEHGRPRAWYFDADELQTEAEITFLRREIYHRELEFRTQFISAIDRFSVRT